jgi:glucose/arabinose dehydrogenase
MSALAAEPGCTRRIALARIGAAGCAGLSPWPATAANAADAARSPTPLQVELLNRELEQPWALATLPDGRLLVTEKPGRMRMLTADGRHVLATLAGLPPVAARGQGGLLDVALDPDFTRDPWIYWAYSEPGDGGVAGFGATSGTAVARGRLAGDRLRDVAVIWHQQPKRSGSGHFGARLVFRPDGTLFITVGDRQADDPRAPGRAFAQNLTTTLGKVVRIHRDGRIPADNPEFPASEGHALPGIWSYGHRNPQGAALHPATGELWLVEHGPQGGDELNRVRPGRNHGWPLRSYGCPYGAPVGEACRVGGGRHAPEFEEPVATWVPTSIAPSDLLFYTGRLFAGWQSPGTGPGQVSALIPSLAGAALWRVVIGGPPEAPREVARERLLADLGERLRCVRQASDGALLLLTDSGKLLRVTPG